MRCKHLLAGTSTIACSAAVATLGPVPLPSPKLLLAAVVAVAKVALYCVVGAWAARKGLVTPEGRRLLSSLALNLLTPCLMLAKLGPGGGVAELWELWPFTANMVASHVLGLLLGLLSVRLAGVPERLRNQMVVSCGVGNVGNLPFVLMAGLAADPALPFAAAMGAGAAAELANRYVAVSGLSAALIQFPITNIFLRKQPEGAAAPKLSWRELAAGALSPPLLASILGLAVASVPTLRDALFAPSGCLRLVGEVVDGLAGACIPILLLVLGANLATGPGVAAGRLPGSCVVAAVLARLVALPLACGAALLAAWKAGLLPASTEPLGLLVMLAMHATPTAVLVHSMATLYGNAEDEVAALLFWQMVACLVTMPLGIAVALAIVAPGAG
ncbi:hypothetical protein HYH03_003719 [Edaphochlamys debaryana]|uniref:Auxin efflux carrier n=1 Tax=Edaphochlamys debaryana TaxID=47281 RepID=A0A835Y8Y0_9CHLO|nr:hypothetical protein HYH03_003719 [Edaphochlamys debaryana]|eukprot:KAG2498465.1 hypothetical protein HYH03_003719 [Edaphochlamys debaryana]